MITISFNYICEHYYLFNVVDMPKIFHDGPSQIIARVKKYDEVHIIYKMKLYVLA